MSNYELTMSNTCVPTSTSIIIALRVCCMNDIWLIRVKHTMKTGSATSLQPCDRPTGVKCTGLIIAKDVIDQLVSNALV